MRRFVTRHLLHLAEARDFAVSAYCFMPDHVHVVLEATSAESELYRLMNNWKQQTGYAYARSTGSKLWQNGYYDHVLRKDEGPARHHCLSSVDPLRAGWCRIYACIRSGVQAYGTRSASGGGTTLIAERTRR
jgi:REP element-mobilizing transposase RayT